MHAKVADTAPFRADADDDDDASDAVVDADLAARDDASTNARVKASSSTTDATQQSSRGMDSKALAAIACASAALVYACVKVIRARIGGGSDRAFAKSHRKCNRCGARGANTRCDRCKRAWYCSSACRSAAWKMEICECC